MSLQAEYPVTSICGVLGLARSSFYHRPKPVDEDDLRATLLELAGQYPTYGYRRLTALLKRTGWTVNHKRVQRLMVEMGLQRPLKRRKKRTTDSQHDFPRYPNLVSEMEILQPDEVWVADITYVRLARDFVYLAVIMDVFTRAVRGWQLSGSAIDPHRAATSAGGSCPGYSPQRSGLAICLRRLHQSARRVRCADQYGRRRQA